MPSNRRRTRTSIASIADSMMSGEDGNSPMFDALKAAAERWAAGATVLPAAPDQASRTTPHDLALLAVQGYDVQASIRAQVGLGISWQQQQWAETFGRALSVAWMPRLGQISDSDLADRWIGATTPMNAAQQAYAMDQLHERIKDLKRIETEKAELRAVIDQDDGPTLSGPDRHPAGRDRSRL